MILVIIEGGLYRRLAILIIGRIKRLRQELFLPVNAYYGR